MQNRKIKKKLTLVFILEKRQQNEIKALFNESGTNGFLKSRQCPNH